MPSSVVIVMVTSDRFSFREFPLLCMSPKSPCVLCGTEDAIRARRHDGAGTGQGLEALLAQSRVSGRNEGRARGDHARRRGRLYPHTLQAETDFSGV